MVCEGLINRINRDASRKGIPAVEKKHRFSNMIPPLFHPKHPAIHQRLRQRHGRMIEKLQAASRESTLAGSTLDSQEDCPLSCELARRQGQREGYEQAMRELDSWADGEDAKSTRSEDARPGKAYEKFEYREDRMEHYREELEDAHRRLKEGIEGRRRNTVPPLGGRRARSEIGGYRKKIEDTCRAECAASGRFGRDGDFLPGRPDGFGYEAQSIGSRHPEPDDFEHGRRDSSLPPCENRVVLQGHREQRPGFIAEERTPLRAQDLSATSIEVSPLRHQHSHGDPDNGAAVRVPAPTVQRQPRGSLYDGSGKEGNQSEDDGADNYPRASGRLGAHVVREGDESTHAARPLVVCVSSQAREV